MLSLPLLEHPPRNADESPAATTIRHAITPPNVVAPGYCCSPPWHRTMADHNPSTHLPTVRKITCGPIAAWDLVGPTNYRQRQYGTPADDSEQELPRILKFPRSKSWLIFTKGLSTKNKGGPKPVSKSVIVPAGNYSSAQTKAAPTLNAFDQRRHRLI